MESAVKRWCIPIAGLTACALAVCIWVGHDAAQERARQRLPVILNGGDGIYNAGLEQWAGNAPVFWTCSDPQGVRKIENDFQDGRIALGMGPKYVYCNVSQTILVDGTLGGKKICFYAYAKANESEKVRIVVKIDENNKGYSDFHPGDGTWRKLMVVYDVPPGLKPLTFEVILNHNDNPQAAALFDKTGLWVE
jgi:hypothetical protein